MAASESQGKTIFLVIFVVLTVIGFSMSYYFYDQTDQLRQQAAGAQKNESEAKKTAQQRLTEYNELRQRSYPTSSDQDHTAVAQLIDQMLQAPKIGDQRITQKPTYTSLQDAVEYLHAQITEADRRIADLEGEKTKLENDLKATNSQYEQKVAVAVKAQDDAVKEKTDEIAKIGATLAQRDVDLAQVQQRAGALRDENEQLKRDIENAAKKSATAIERLTLRMEELQREASIAKQTEFEHEDGVIQYVDGTRAYLNVGLRDGARRGLTFGVYGKDAGGNPYQLPKANLEIVRLEGDRRSEGKIINSNLTEPVLPGDVIYNPIWSPGARESIAFVGHVHLDDDDTPDNEKFKQLVIENGGKVDAEVNLKTGEIKGEVSVKTGWLVIADIPEFVDEGEQKQNVDQNKEAELLIKAATELRKQAQFAGVRPISVRLFLNSLGYRNPRRLVKAGEEERFLQNKTRKPEADTKSVGEPASKKSTNE